MKNGFIYAVTLVMFLAACNKNKFTTEPQLEYKSISPETVFQGDIIKFKSKFTDKEGDVDSALIVYKWYDGAAVVRADTIRNYTFEALNLPPNTDEGEIIIEFVYARFVPPYPEIGAVLKDTTSAFGLILIDKAKNRSNYIESDPFRLIKP